MHELSGAGDAALDLFAAAASSWQAEGDVLEHGQVWEDGIVLEDHGDAAVARRQMVDAAATDPDLAWLGVSSRRQSQQRGSCATGGAEQHMNSWSAMARSPDEAR